MAQRYTSLMALVLDRAVDDVGAVVGAARAGGRIDRHAPVGDPREAAEVRWGGRMQRAVVRAVESDDGEPLLRAETYVGADTVKEGLRRHAQLLRALAQATDRDVRGVRDLSAATDRDTAWLERVAAGDVDLEDGVIVHDEGRGTVWVHTHGAARFDVPDLELYGVKRSQVEPAARALRRVHDQLLRGGLRTELSLPDGTPVRLVPVRRAWQHLPLDWPGVGRAGQNRPGHDGPRASLSLMHRRWFGRYRTDLDGVLEALEPTG